MLALPVLVRHAWPRCAMLIRALALLGGFTTIAACQPAVRTIVPLEEAFTGHWLVSVEMSDERFAWGLDTGAPMSVVDPEFLEKVPAMHTGTIETAPPGFELSGFRDDKQPDEVQLVTLHDYRLSTARIRVHRNVAMADLGHIRERGVEIYGVLGLDALSPRPFELHPCALTLTIFDAPPRRLPAGTQVPVYVSHSGSGYITLELAVDGQQVEFFMDTGANYSSISRATAERVFGGRPPDDTETRPMSTILKTRENFESEIFRAAALEFAGVTLESAEFRVDEGAQKNLLGMDVISQFRWYVDLNREVAIVQGGLDCAQSSAAAEPRASRGDVLNSPPG